MIDATNAYKASNAATKSHQSP